MERLQISYENSVAVVAFANPPRNYMDSQTGVEFLAFLNEVEGRSNIRVVILIGAAPDVFIRHYNVGELEDRARGMATKGMTFDETRPVPESDIHQCFRTMAASEKIFIAALNGSAMGGGFETALACDIRLVQDGPYDLGLPEANIGLLPGAGGTQRLPRLIGQSRAMQMMLLGKTISPREAVEIGLAFECVEGDVLARAKEIAVDLATKAPKPLAHIKRLANLAMSTPLEDGLKVERTLFCDLMVDERSINEMAKFNNGPQDIRNPNFRAGGDDNG